MSNIYKFVIVVLLAGNLVVGLLILDELKNHRKTQVEAVKLFQGLWILETAEANKILKAKLAQYPPPSNKETK